MVSKTQTVRHVPCLIIFFCLLSCLKYLDAIRYEPNWESIDSRPLPSWYDESKIGIMVVWGVYAVPSLRTEWFWNFWRTREDPTLVKFMNENYRPDWTYQDFAQEFTAELFNPDQWADLFNASGARYIVLTSKHHEGYTLWPSKYAYSWNSMDVGSKRDLVGELAQSIRTRTNIHFGLYHSLFEWYNPLFLQDEQNGFETHDFVKFKTMPELTEIVNMYKPEIIWSDGSGKAPDSYWNATEFLAWLYNDSPVKDTVVVNDRWGINITCHHGGFLTCKDKYNPGSLLNRKWEGAVTLDKGSWGFRRDATMKDIVTMEEMLATIAEVVSCGGNILINVGPTHDGRIIPVFEDRFRELGAWLNVNGEAIYSSKPWKYQNDTVTSGVWYTAKKPPEGGLDVYAFVLKWPDTGLFHLGSPTPTADTIVTLLGYPDQIQWESDSKGMNLIIPSIPFNRMPCKYVWVFKMTNLF